MCYDETWHVAGVVKLMILTEQYNWLFLLQVKAEAKGDVPSVKVKKHKPKSKLNMPFGFGKKKGASSILFTRLHYFVVCLYGMSVTKFD